MSVEPKSKGHILLVDDELSLLSALAEFLQDQEYDVDTAPNGATARERLGERIYDLMVTDYRMPDISGMDLLEFAKQAYPDMEVVLITGYGSKESVIEAIRLGAYDYIEKPFDTVDLLKTIINCLETINLKRRVETLVEDLRENERHLQQVIKTQNAELISQKHKLLFVDTTKASLHSIADEINDTAGEIWNHVSKCRQREDTYLADVNRLITACVKATRSLSTTIENLEGIVRQFDTEEPSIAETGSEAPHELQTSAVLATSNENEAQEIESEIDSIYEQLYEFLDGTISAHQMKKPLNIERAFEIVPRILDIPGATDILYRRAIYTKSTETEWGIVSAVLIHSINVAVYALRIAEGLGYTRENAIDLGAAALVHDLGMVDLPFEIFTKGSLDLKDITLLRKHPGHTYESLMKNSAESCRWLADIVVQEHEREDGTGYPDGLVGDQIHEYAKIIGVADTYDGFTRSRPERRGLLPFDAVKEITQNHKQKFHPALLRALLHKLSAFPVGSLVRLNSGSIAEVVEMDETYPLRPTVKVLYNAKGRAMAQAKTISLQENPILHVSGTVYHEDLHSQ